MAQHFLYILVFWGLILFFFTVRLFLSMMLQIEIFQVKLSTAFVSMQTLSPSSASLPTCQDACPTYDELSMQQSLLFSDILKDLKNLRSQLYSAAEYFELSYTNDDHKQTVVDTLKDYAVKALVNTVDHLGSVSYKVNDLLDEKFDDVSGTELRVSCIEQRLRTCQGFIDHEGFSQQSLVMTTPKYHKRYILPDGKSMPGSGRQAVPHHQKVNQPKGERESQQHQAALCATIKDNSPSFRKMFSRSPSLRARSNSPSPKIRSPSPSPQLGKSVFSDKGAGLPIPTSKPNPLLRSGSLSSKPTVLNPSKNVRRHPTKPEKSASMRLHAERDQHDAEQSPSKSKRLLKALLSRRKSRKDEMLDTYLDEY